MPGWGSHPNLRRSGSLGCQRADAVARRSNRLHLVLGAHAYAFGTDELDVGDADEAEHRAQVVLLEIQPSGRAAAVYAAAAGGHDDALAGRQALRAVLGVAEGLAGDHHAIDPGLELAGN